MMFDEMGDFYSVYHTYLSETAKNEYETYAYEYILLKTNIFDKNSIGMNIYKIILIERVTGSPELRQNNSGKAFINFSIAIEQFTKNDENKTDFSAVQHGENSRIYDVKSTRYVHNRESRGTPRRIR